MSATGVTFDDSSYTNGAYAEFMRKQKAAADAAAAAADGAYTSNGLNTYLGAAATNNGLNPNAPVPTSSTTPIGGGPNPSGSSIGSPAYADWMLANPPGASNTSTPNPDGSYGTPTTPNVDPNHPNGGAPAPAPPPSLLADPGAYENWLKANMGKLDTPTNYENLYSSGLASTLNNSSLNNLSPVSQGGYTVGAGPNADASQGILGSAPTSSVSANLLNRTPNASASTGLLSGSGPQNGNSASLLSSGGPQVGTSASVLSAMQEGGASRQLLNSGGTGANTAAAFYGENTLDPQASKNVLAGGVDAGNSKDIFSNLSQTPSNATNVFTQANGAIGGPGEVERLYQDQGRAFNAPGAYEQQFAKDGTTAFADPNAYEKYYAAYGQDPNQKGYTENLYESGVGQLDPYYDNAVKRSIETAQRASAARGGFNSGLAAQQEGDITSNLRGQQAKAWVDLAPIADSAALARRNQGSTFAKTAADEYSQRIKDAYGVAAGEDTSYANRINNMFGLADTTQKSMNDRFKTLSGIASAGDAADLGKSSLRVTAANNADQNAIGAFSAKGAIANNADQNDIAGYSARGNAANNADTQAVNSYRAIGDVSANADASHNAFNNTQVTGANNVDANSINAFRALGDVSANADTSANQAFATRGTIAGNADRTAADIFGTQGTIAGNADQTAAQIYGSQVTAAGNADSAAIDKYKAEQLSLYQSGQLSLQQFQANIDLATQQDSNRRSTVAEQFNIAGGADASSLGRLTTQGSMARDLQSTGQDRILGGLGATTAQATKDSALAQNIWGDMSSVNSLDQPALQALADKYGLTLAQMNDLAKSNSDQNAFFLKLAGFMK